MGIEPGTRTMAQMNLARAGGTYAKPTGRYHWTTGNDETLCGRLVVQYVDFHEYMEIAYPDDPDAPRRDLMCRTCGHLAHLATTPVEKKETPVGQTSDISQAAAVSALIKRKAGVTPRPSGASNAHEYAVIVRRGTCGGGASIMIGHSTWSPEELDAVADRIETALTGAGYVFDRRDNTADRSVSFRSVKKADLSRRRRVSLRLMFDVDPEQYQKVYGDLTAENTITLAVRDYVANLLLNSPLAQEGVLLGGVDSSVNIHAQADR